MQKHKIEHVDTLYVHGGIFHADDAMCAAMVRRTFPDAEVKRVFMVPDEIGKHDIVADIGGGKYDHHQDAALRENGHPYAACGLLFEDLKDRLVKDAESMSKEDEKAVEDFYKAFEEIQDLDNGIKPDDPGYGTILAELVSSFNPEWNDSRTPDESFEGAIVFCDRIIGFHLDHEWQRYGEDYGDAFEQLTAELVGMLEKANEHHEKAVKEAENIVTKALDDSDGHTVVLPQYAPWDDVLIPSSVEFVVFPSNRGGYMLQCVPPEKGSFEQKIPLEWDEKPDGMMFCHSCKFIAQFETQEEAVNAAQTILEKETEVNEHEAEEEQGE